MKPNLEVRQDFKRFHGSNVRLGGMLNDFLLDVLERLVDASNLTLPVCVEIFLLQSLKNEMLK